MLSAPIPHEIDRRDARNWGSNPALLMIMLSSLRRQLKYLPMSSGKSTFLALVRLAWDLCQGSSPLDLNEEPFLLGAYDQIASSRRGPGGRSQQFCIGAEVISKGPKRRRRSAVRFT